MLAVIKVDKKRQTESKNTAEESKNKIHCIEPGHFRNSVTFIM